MFSAIMLCIVCGCGNVETDYSSIVIYEDEEIIYNQSETTSLNSVESTVSSQDVAVNSNVTSSNQQSTDEPAVENLENKFYLNDTSTLQYIKTNGRCEKTDKGINLNHAASAIEINTNSTSVLLEVETDTSLYYTIIIDDKITVQHQAVENSGINYIVVARGLDSTNHNIKFIRDSESRSNLKMTVLSIQLDDNKTLLTKDGNNKIIEFLGDSLTSGYGNMATNGVKNASNLEYLSATNAYPFLIANKLGLDYRIVSMSGIALGKREGYPTFEEFYNLESYNNDTTKQYTSSNPQDVDIVVVNLGTNDASDKLYDEKNTGSVKKYGKFFADLITNVGYRKDVDVVFVSGVCWSHAQIPAYNVAVSELNARGYNNVYTIDIPTYNSGGGGHPSADEHKQTADLIIKFFKDNGIS